MSHLLRHLPRCAAALATTAFLTGCLRDPAEIVPTTPADMAPSEAPPSTPFTEEPGGPTPPMGDGNGGTFGFAPAGASAATDNLYLASLKVAKLSAADIIWRHESGAQVIWRRAGEYPYRGDVIASQPDANWKVADTADFDGDGYEDLLYRHATAGINIMQFGDARGRFPTSARLPDVERNWRLAGAYDFNRDGFADLIWQHPSGPVVLWLMRASEVLGMTTIFNMPDPWRIASVGDFDGDGLGDLFWRNDVTSDAAVWYLNANGQTRGQAILPGKLGPEWETFGAASIDNGVREHIHFRHKATGDIVVWQLDEGRVAASSAITSLPRSTGWIPIAVPRRGVRATAAPAATSPALKAAGVTNIAFTDASERWDDAAGNRTTNLAFAVYGLRADNTVAFTSGTTMSVSLEASGPKLLKQALSSGTTPYRAPVDDAVVSEAYRLAVGSTKAGATNYYVPKPSGVEVCSEPLKDSFNRELLFAAALISCPFEKATGLAQKALYAVSGAFTLSGLSLGCLQAVRLECEQSAANDRADCCMGFMPTSQVTPSICRPLPNLDWPDATTCKTCPNGAARHRFNADSSAIFPEIRSTCDRPKCRNALIEHNSIDKLPAGFSCEVDPNEEVIAYGRKLRFEGTPTQTSQSTIVDYKHRLTTQTPLPSMLTFDGPEQTNSCSWDFGRNPGGARSCPADIEINGAWKRVQQRTMSGQILRDETIPVTYTYTATGTANWCFRSTIEQREFRRIAVHPYGSVALLSESPPARTSPRHDQWTYYPCGEANHPASN